MLSFLCILGEKEPRSEKNKKNKKQANQLQCQTYLQSNLHSPLTHDVSMRNIMLKCIIIFKLIKPTYFKIFIWTLIFVLVFFVAAKEITTDLEA